MKKSLFNILIYSSIIFGVTFLWQGLELLIYGEIQHRVVDDIIGLILIFSLLANVMLIKQNYDFKKALESLNKTLKKCEKNVGELVSDALKILASMNHLKSSMKILDKILVDTISNEDEEMSNITKFNTIKQLAVHIKAMNDVNLNYIDSILSGENKKTASSDNDNDKTK